jgi:hypothetical protein
MKDITYRIKQIDTPEAKKLWTNLKKIAEEIKDAPEWKSPKLPSLVPRFDFNGEKVILKQKGLKVKIVSLEEKYNKLTAQASTIYQKKTELVNRLQSKCEHELCLERTTSYKGEYDEWHNNYPERKCVDCFLVDKSNYNGYNKLKNSQVIELVIKKEDKVFSLDFEDLKP